MQKYNDYHLQQAMQWLPLNTKPAISKKIIFTNKMSLAYYNQEDIFSEQNVRHPFGCHFRL